MSSSAAKIAQRLRTAYGVGTTEGHALMTSLYAETIELRHEPPIPSDGPLPSTLFRQLAALEIAAVERALPDRSHKTEFVVDGDVIRMTSTTAGTLAGEGRIQVTTEAHLTVRDNRIVGLRANLDPDAQALWGKVLAAGNFQLPPEILEQFPASNAG